MKLNDRTTILRFIEKTRDIIIETNETDEDYRRLTDDLEFLQLKLAEIEGVDSQDKKSALSTQLSSHVQEKISLFRSLFRGREDVYPKLWISKRSGRTGYTPVCENEWIQDICRKPAVRCAECENRNLSPLTDEIIKMHLDGVITIGVYPLLKDETCHFLAIDFDGQDWKDDVLTFLSICKQKNVPATLERSRSGNGGHIWIFFSEKIQASIARKMGSCLLSSAMDNRFQLNMKSYDRLFPNQDTLPKGGFGNLIALPLQKIPMEKGNSVFIYENFNSYPDQWEYLSNIRKMSLDDVKDVISKLKENDFTEPVLDRDNYDNKPWEKPILYKRLSQKLTCKLPDKVQIVLANRIYINKKDLPSQLLSQIRRIVTFQNPEFYKKQGMRLSTARIPRIICCSEEIDNYFTIPRGCLEELKVLLSENDIYLDIEDKRFEGDRIDVEFSGELTDVQEKALNELTKHDFGVLVAPPGIGKTVMGIHLIASRKRNTLILVHRKPLLEQWRSQLSYFLNISEKDLSQIGDNKNKSTSLIDIAMLQSLDRKGEVDMRIKNYGQVIVDECHHVPAVSFERVMMEANAKYIVGLTATPYRRDGHEPIIMMQCGKVRHKINPKTIENFSFDKRLITRETTFSYQWNETDTIHNVWQLLINDEDRNQMIYDDVIAVVRSGRNPIVLTERREHLKILKEKFSGYVKNLIILHGGVKIGERKEMIDKLSNVPDTEERLIVATGAYIGEGFDDSRLDTLFIAMPISFKGKLLQYSGRLNRSYNGKTEVRIYDYLDKNVPVLERMYKRRLNAYKSFGFLQN